ncbi:MAG TPA: ABC transporter ATP-binding protein [Thermomicrobiales bacterium]|nr:ABC transporter ATP-binding protein [Thermomicrobiales bacterium]
MATTATTNEAVGLRAVSKSFGATQAIEHVSLSVARDEIVALVGPSGCGKSTVLSIVAGLLDPDEGDVRLDGQLAPDRLGRVALMPQRDALLPWRTVVDNAVLGPQITGTDLRQARERARSLLPRFGLDGFGDYYPAALSGGMRQRAAFLRTVLTDRETMLLDEPFGALDALTRRSMQEWLLDLWGDIGGAIILVTHDVEEALLLSDRVAVMTARPGRIKLVEPVVLPRPREPRMVDLPEAVAQKARLLTALHDEVALAMGARR